LQNNHEVLTETGLLSAMKLAKQVQQPQITFDKFLKSQHEPSVQLSPAILLEKASCDQILVECIPEQLSIDVSNNEDKSGECLQLIASN